MNDDPECKRLKYEWENNVFAWAARASASADAEISRLSQEVSDLKEQRDSARREVCETSIAVAEPQDVAVARGWGYLYHKEQETS